MLKSIFTFYFLFIIFGSCYSQTFEWAKSFRSEYDFDNQRLGQSRGMNIDVDINGNVITTGYFSGIVDFDPGPGIFNLTSKEDYDIFIIKLDSDGNFVWAKSIGNGFGYSIVADKSGNIYVCGTFENTVDFDPGIGIYNITSAGNDDIFIIKLDADGNFLWAKSIGGISIDIANSITIGNGNILVTGHFAGTVDFDPGPNIYNLNVGGAFILKLDSAGKFIWAKSFEGNTTSNSICVDNNGNIFTTGKFRGIVDFNPGIGVFNISSTAGWPNEDIFISKLDNTGNFIWAKSIGDSGDDEGLSITTDNLGNIYTTGFFEGTVDFDPEAGIYNLTANINISTNREDIFILKLDEKGNFVWARNMGGQEVDAGYSIKVDKYGNVYSTGMFRIMADFDPGPGIYNLGYQAGLLIHHIFISKLDSNGNFVWAHRIEDKLYSDSEGHSIYVDFFQNIYLTGFFEKYGDFDPGPDTFVLTTNYNFDAFVLKLSQCTATSGIDSITTCNSFTWIDSNTYTSSTDTAVYVLENAEGCDSIVTLNLTILHDDTTHLVHEVCEQYSWHGQTYTQSGTYTYDTLNTMGCDSLLMLELIINNPDSTSIVQSACESFIWQGDTLTQSGTYTYQTTNTHGCDSTVTLDLTINTSTESNTGYTACDSYIWNGDTLVQSGVYEYNTSNINGCDSTAILNLTINKSDSTNINQTACESYTWNEHTYNQSGIYTFDTLNIYGCDSTAILNLTIVDMIEKLDTMQICDGDTVNILGQKVWQEKLITKTYTSQAGCDSIQSVQILVNPLLSATINAKICQDDSIYLIDRWLSEAGEYTITKPNTNSCDSVYTVNLSVIPKTSSLEKISLCPGDSILINNNRVNQSGTYTEIYTNAQGCDSIRNIKLTVLQQPSEPTMEIDCDALEIITTIQASPDWQILWDTGDTTTQSIYKNQNQATVTLTALPDCNQQYTIDLPVLPKQNEISFPVDTTIKEDSTLTINLSLDKSNWQIQWSPSDIIDCDTCTEVRIKPVEDTQIHLILTHSSGCSYEAYFTIKLIRQNTDLNIPNIFTPNGDGTNDIWRISIPNGVKIKTCTIYDRWGEKIYSTKGDINWDGSYKGKKAMQGVYVYYIEYIDKKGENKVAVGDVTVVR